MQIHLSILKVEIFLVLNYLQENMQNAGIAGVMKYKSYQNIKK